MKIGFPKELLNFNWVAQLKEYIDQTVAGIEWVHVPCAKGSQTDTMMLSEGDACFPFKKIIRAAVGILPEVEKLFVPRLVRLDSHLLCPNFRALPDIVALNRARLPADYQRIPIIDTVIDISNQEDTRLTYKKVIDDLLGSQKKIPQTKVFDPTNKKAWPLFSGERDSATNHQKTIGLIGRSYMINDPQLNMGIPALLESYGYSVITPQNVEFEELDRLATRQDYYAKTLYWRGAREALGAFFHFTERLKPAGIIYQLAFNCGVDALVRIELMSLHKKLKRKIPFMVLVGDEHTQREHLVTRLEAFLDVIDGITAA